MRQTCSCNTATCHCGTVIVHPPAPIPHIWTTDEIADLPPFGSEMGWFYGLSTTDVGGDSAIVLVEIFPGDGWSVASPETPEDWAQVRADLRNYRPWTAAASGGKR